MDAAQSRMTENVAQRAATTAQDRAQSAQVDSARHSSRWRGAVRSAAARGSSSKRRAPSSTQSGYSIIRAPVDGWMVARNVDVGRTVAASLQAPTLFLIAQDLHENAGGHSTDESTSAASGRPAGDLHRRLVPRSDFSGQVVQVRKAPQVLQNVVTYDVVVSAPTPSWCFCRYDRVNVRIIIDQKNSAMRVPDAALRFRPPGAQTGQVRAEPAEPSAVQDSDHALAARVPSLVPTRQVWVADSGGKLRAISVRLGITDSIVTEVLEDELSDQQDVIVGMDSGSKQSAASKSGPRWGLERRVACPSGR